VSTGRTVATSATSLTRPHYLHRPHILLPPAPLPPPPLPSPGRTSCTVCTVLFEHACHTLDRRAALRRGMGGVALCAALWLGQFVPGLGRWAWRAYGACAALGSQPAAQLGVAALLLFSDGRGMASAAAWITCAATPLISRRELGDMSAAAAATSLAAPTAAPEVCPCAGCPCTCCPFTGLIAPGCCSRRSIGAALCMLLLRVSVHVAMRVASARPCARHTDHTS